MASASTSCKWNITRITQRVIGLCNTRPHLCNMSFPWVTLVSTSLSLLSLDWGITSLEKIRKKRGYGQRTTTFPKRSLIVFILWQLGILVSRLSAIVIFAYVFRSYVFIVIGIHWTAVIVVMLINQYNDKDFELFNVKKYVKRAVSIFTTSYPLLFHMSSYTSRFMFRNFGKKTAKILNVVYHAVFFSENVIMVSFCLARTNKCFAH